MPAICGAIGWLASIATPPNVEALPEERAAFVGKRRALAANLGVAAGATIIGALTVSLPLATWNQRDGTPLVTPLAIGSVLMVSGGFAVPALASVLAHHERWHRPGLAVDADLAARRRRGLRIGVGVSLGSVGLGAIALGLGIGLGRSCDPVGNCPASIAGVTIGSTLIGGGAMSTVATGTLLGIHNAHRHDRVRATPGGLAIRF
jgi:hypothetical protein